MKLGDKMLSVILGVVLAAIFIGYLLPVGMDAYYNADTSGWDSAEANIFGVLGIFLILVPLIVLAKAAMEA